MTVRCGHKTHDTGVAAVHHHETVELVRICFTLEHGAYSLEESDYNDAQSEAFDPDQAYERFLENGGAHAGQIQDEDLHEQELEAHDPFLQHLREGRQTAEERMQALFGV